MFLPENIHPSWDDFLTPEILEELDNIENKIGDNFVPTKENVLRFMKNDLMKVKCVWQGQDPYYTMYVDKDTKKELPVANGRSFQPDLLNSWQDSFTQKSLQNIIRLIHKNYNNIENYKDIKSFNQIRKEISNGDFKILEPHEWFNSLEEQGVLFLNTYFTTIGKGNVHRKIWINFSKKLLKYISTKNPGIRWFLWGAQAIDLENYLLSGEIYKSNHPTFCSEKYENDFLKNDCFKDTMNEINWLGVQK